MLAAKTDHSNALVQTAAVDDAAASPGFEWKLQKRAWDERYGEVIGQKRNWQRIAFALALCLPVAVGGMIYLGRLPKTSTQVVLVNAATGETSLANRAGGTAAMDAAAWNKVKRMAFTQMVTDWRTVTTDTRLQEKLWDSTYEWVEGGSPAQMDVYRWFQDHNPIRRSQQETVSVSIDTTAPVTDHTYEVWWTETAYKGGQATVSKHRYLFTYRITGNPVSAQNGLGILVSQMPELPGEGK